MAWLSWVIQSAGSTSVKPTRLSVAAFGRSSSPPCARSSASGTLAQREVGIHHEVITQQLAGALDGLTPQTLWRIILAYEPVWAIGTGRTATPEIAQEVHVAIRNWLAGKFGGEAAQEMQILYGGSVKPENIADLMRQPDIDGALVGGACLEAQSFLRIIHYS